MNSFNPLLSLHEQAGAETIACGPTSIVNTFGQPEAEYAAVHKACALFDLPQRAILELTGTDRHAFLNNLLTNQIFDKQSKTGLSAGRGGYSFLLSAKGRIVADINVLETGDDRTLLELDARVAEPVRDALEKYLFAEKVKIASRAGELHQLALHGPHAKSLLDELLESPLPDLEPLGSAPASLWGYEIIIWRDDVTGSTGLNLIVDTAAVEEIWTKIVQRYAEPEQLGRRRLRPAGWAVFNAARIEAGRALFGIDFDESVLPGETGLLDRAVSFTKGCYLGQEIVARMQSRDQLARKLVGIRMESDALPIAGAKIFDEQSNEIGGITSSTISPVLSNAAICLGYLKRPFFEMGTVVHVPAEGAVRKGTVVPTPFR